ncbi:rRNA adenine N-6-methyltransferase family protein, partial [Pseudoalteromonas piscicida]|uniref:rRNA adenine N-6-methyltransferase family protein n=1 Tax=Pseudoalteromonas piscicida TaxID=43662 RepID=UPI0012807E43
DPQPEDNVVEIGPGLGALTEPVCEFSGHLTVVELDKDLAERLIHPPFLGPKLTVHQGDPMKFAFSSLIIEGERVKKIGIFPSNLRTPILCK